jgi:CheY-like chemotaxis protein
MGTQSLETESSIRKPSSIGEESRKEREKRGLRAPKSDPQKPNGKEAETSVETPIQITVVEDSQEDINVEVKPIAQIDEGEVVEEFDDSSAKTEVVAEEEPLVVEEPPEELESLAGEEPPIAEERVDTKPLDAVSKEPIEGPTLEEISEEAEGLEPILLSPPQDVDAGDDDQGIVEGPNFVILPQEESEETLVHFDPLVEVEVPEETLVHFDPLTEVEEPYSVPVQPPDDDQVEEIEFSEAQEVEWQQGPPNDLPETAELDEGTVDVLKSYTKARSSAGFDVDPTSKSDVIDSLLSVASHELRSPLQAISGFLELLVNSGASDSRQEEQFLSIAYRESSRLGDIIADLETASLVESGKLKLHLAPFSMDHLIQSCIEKFKQPEWEGEIFLADARLKDLPDLHGDEIYLRQALNNLIGAVLRPLSVSHHVFIRTVVDDFDLVIQLISGEENPSDQTLPDMRAARGEFYDIGHEGLGIFVARHIIEAHGGGLISQGAEHGGLTYTLQLPLKPRTESRGTVLITEDNTHAALLMEYALERDGYVPIKARNGLEALEIVANDEVDLVILDVVLPGMDGFEVCYRMRSSPETASIPVVIVSAKVGDEYRAKALRVGADAYFKKPLVLADLLVTMEKLLENMDVEDQEEEPEEVDPA